MTLAHWRTRSSIGRPQCRAARAAWRPLASRAMAADQPATPKRVRRTAVASSAPRTAPGVARPPRAAQPGEVAVEELVAQRRGLPGRHVEIEQARAQEVPGILAGRAQPRQLPVDRHRLLDAVGGAAGEEIPAPGIVVREDLRQPLQRAQPAVALTPDVQDGARGEIGERGAQQRLLPDRRVLQRGDEVRRIPDPGAQQAATERRRDGRVGGQGPRAVEATEVLGRQAVARERPGRALLTQWA